MRNISAELIKYKPIDRWSPKPGDIIIKHGFFVRTKWYGVVAGFDGNFVDVIVDGMPRLLVMSNKLEMDSKTKNINISEIMSSLIGSYTVFSVDNGLQIVYI